jgi:hypothetical protein
MPTTGAGSRASRSLPGLILKSPSTCGLKALFARHGGKSEYSWVAGRTRLTVRSAGTRSMSPDTTQTVPGLLCHRLDGASVPLWVGVG